MYMNTYINFVFKQFSKLHNYILNISNLFFPLPNMYWISFHVYIYRTM